jgi:hypothetical protein
LEQACEIGDHLKKKKKKEKERKENRKEKGGIGKPALV